MVAFPGKQGGPGLLLPCLISAIIVHVKDKAGAVSGRLSSSQGSGPALGVGHVEALGVTENLTIQFPSCPQQGKLSAILSATLYGGFGEV